MNLFDTFAPTRQEALARISAVSPNEYARSRNSLTGAVTGLSPYITHGALTLPQVLQAVQRVVMDEVADRRLRRQHVFEPVGEAMQAVAERRRRSARAGRMVEQPLDRTLAGPGEAIFDLLDLFGRMDASTEGGL